VRIATWNVNSIKKRLPHVLAFLAEVKPDVLLLQETKCVDADFPKLAIQGAGYHSIEHGQKAYNGVALIARARIEDPMIGLPGGDEDAQALDTQTRYVEATIEGVRVASLYLPNGNPVGTEKFTYKLAWMERLAKHARALLAREAPTVLAGDYNVAPADADVYAPEKYRDEALCRPETRAAWRTLLHMGFTDALRALHPDETIYTYWDYMQNRWPQNHGWRIDHLLLSPQAADRLVAAGVDKGPRAKQDPSDHTPAWCELAG
jgi:exodeoxyribonuclease-3